MKQLLLQAFNLIRQNPFYATISIIGTAVTIAFVMVVVMIYDFRTMDMAPESDGQCDNRAYGLAAFRHDGCGRKRISK